MNIKTIFGILSFALASSAVCAAGAPSFMQKQDPFWSLDEKMNQLVADMQQWDVDLAQDGFNEIADFPKPATINAHSCKPPKCRAYSEQTQIHLDETGHYQYENTINRNGQVKSIRRDGTLQKHASKKAQPLVTLENAEGQAVVHLYY